MKPLPHHVFISYAAPNRSIAEAVCTSLEKRQIRCWIAPRDILPGSDYTRSIHQAIEESRTMVLIFSSHANTSPHVLRETETAVKRNLEIIPFRVEDVEPSGAMQYYLGASHRLDAFTPPLDTHIAHLVESLEARDPAVCAGRMNRVKACLIDLVFAAMLWLLAFVGVWVAGTLLWGSRWNSLMQNSSGSNTPLGNYLVVGVFGVTFFLYFFLLDQSRFHASIGKGVMGMTVVNVKNEVAPRTTLLVRDGIKCASSLCLFIPVGLEITVTATAIIFLLLFLPVFFTRKQQALHDWVAGTFVVKKK